VKAWDETLTELFNKLRPICYKDSELLNIILLWAKNNFEQFNLRSVISLEMINDKKFKEFEIKRILQLSAIEIGMKCGFGKKEIKMDWYSENDSLFSRTTDLVPKYIEHKFIPQEELRLSFICLKRHPTSWYQNKSNLDWISEECKESDKCL